MNGHGLAMNWAGYPFIPIAELQIGVESLRLDKTGCGEGVRMPDSAVLDLHGYSWAEALAAYIEYHNQALRLASGGAVGRREIVHGYGSTGEGGVILRRLRPYLERHPEQVQVAYDSNLGHTYVTPLSALPEIEDMLQEEILDYCDKPRTQSKIAGKFRRHGDPAVLVALRALAREGRLKRSDMDKHKSYQSE
jgi:hypothetical protein